MKDTIFQKLKQAYSQLGLGDAFLQARAEMLDSLGFVNAENVDDVVAKQKASLEAVQKANDARVTEALKKAEETAKKKAEEDAKKKAEEKAQKEAEEAAKKAEEERKKAEEDAKKGGLTPEIKAYLDELEKAHKKALEDQRAAYETQINSLSDSVKNLKNTHDAAELARARAERQSKILNKAKELGIPQSRIDEGFVIADDADDNAISTYLSTVKKNIDASKLPGANHFALGSENPTKEEIADIADALVEG